MDELNRRKRNEYEYLRLREGQICQDILEGKVVNNPKKSGKEQPLVDSLKIISKINWQPLWGLSDEGLDQIYFVHASDGDKNLHNGLNKSQFMMSRLFRDHCNLEKIALKFPTAKLSLDDLKVAWNFPKYWKSKNFLLQFIHVLTAKLLLPNKTQPLARPWRNLLHSPLLSPSRWKFLDFTK